MSYVSNDALTTLGYDYLSAYRCVAITGLQEYWSNDALLALRDRARAEESAAPGEVSSTARAGRRVAAAGKVAGLQKKVGAKYFNNILNAFEAI